MSRTTHAALDDHLASMPDLPPVVWENTELPQGIQSDIWLETKFMPTSADYGSLGQNGSIHERGVYQVTISAPVGQGIGEAEILADRIIEHFRNKTISNIRMQLPKRAQTLTENGRMRLSVEIRYLVETFL